MTSIHFGILSLFDHFIIIPPKQGGSKILPDDISLGNVVNEHKLFHKWHSLLQEVFEELKAGSEGMKKLTVGSK